MRSTIGAPYADSAAATMEVWRGWQHDPVPAYVIYQGEITDPDKYEQYKPLSGASIKAAGGRLIVRGGDTESLEGEAPPGRTVVIEFPTRQAAVDWYNSADYVAAREIRKDAAIARMYVVDGYDG
ncbi:MAG TPA: DUF1330 domain-containing protein [Mycobacteriales bacterium]|nr:DUF1330 domain-containing protein [Mycobacteriales bacterium]